MEVTQEPRSRRRRPAKTPLSRQWIIDATVKVMQEEGLSKATMRRVAQELDTGPASLYVYVKNTAELHAAVIDELVGRTPATAAGSWQERVRALVTGYRDVLRTHPGLARSALVVRPAGPNLLRLFDRLMGLLIEGGTDTGTAGWGADLLLQTATATAAEHAPADRGVEMGLDGPCDPAERDRARRTHGRAVPHPAPGCPG